MRKIAFVSTLALISLSVLLSLLPPIPAQSKVKPQYYPPYGYLTLHLNLHNVDESTGQPIAGMTVKIRGMHDVNGVPTEYWVTKVTNSNGNTGFFYITGIRDAYGYTSIHVEGYINGILVGTRNLYLSPGSTITIHW